MLLPTNISSQANDGQIQSRVSNGKNLAPKKENLQQDLPQQQQKHAATPIVGNLLQKGINSHDSRVIGRSNHTRNNSKVAIQVSKDASANGQPGNFQNQQQHQEDMKRAVSNAVNQGFTDSSAVGQGLVFNEHDTNLISSGKKPQDYPTSKTDPQNAASSSQPKKQKQQVEGAQQTENMNKKSSRRGGAGQTGSNGISGIENIVETASWNDLLIDRNMKPPVTTAGTGKQNTKTSKYQDNQKKEQQVLVTQQKQQNMKHSSREDMSPQKVEKRLDQANFAQNSEQWAMQIRGNKGNAQPPNDRQTKSQSEAHFGLESLEGSNSHTKFLQEDLQCVNSLNLSQVNEISPKNIILAGSDFNQDRKSPKTKEAAAIGEYNINSTANKRLPASKTEQTLVLHQTNSKQQYDTFKSIVHEQSKSPKNVILSGNSAQFGNLALPKELIETFVKNSIQQNPNLKKSNNGVVGESQWSLADEVVGGSNQVQGFKQSYTSSILLTERLKDIEPQYEDNGRLANEADVEGIQMGQTNGGSEPDPGRRRRERIDRERIARNAQNQLHDYKIKDLRDRGDNSAAAGMTLLDEIEVQKEQLASTGYLRKNNFLSDSTASVMYQKAESQPQQHNIQQNGSPNSSQPEQEQQTHHHLDLISNNDNDEDEDVEDQEDVESIEQANQTKSHYEQKMYNLKQKKKMRKSNQMNPYAFNQQSNGSMNSVQNFNAQQQMYEPAQHYNQHMQFNTNQPNLNNQSYQANQRRVNSNVTSWGTGRGVPQKPQGGMIGSFNYRQSALNQQDQLTSQDRMDIFYERNVIWKQSVENKCTQQLEMKEATKQFKELEECTFKPKLITNQKIYKNNYRDQGTQQMYINNERKRALLELDQDQINQLNREELELKEGQFAERMNQWKASVEYKKVVDQEHVRREEMKPCTFQPFLISQELKGEAVQARRIQLDHDKIFSASYVQPFPQEFTLNPSQRRPLQTQLPNEEEKQRIFEEFLMRQNQWNEKRVRGNQSFNAQLEAHERIQCPFTPQINSVSRSISGVKLQNAIENLDPATFYKPCLSKVMTAAAQQGFKVNEDPRFIELKRNWNDLDPQQIYLHMQHIAQNPTGIQINNNSTSHRRNESDDYSEGNSASVVMKDQQISVQEVSGATQHSVSEHSAEQVDDFLSSPQPCHLTQQPEPQVSNSRSAIEEIEGEMMNDQQCMIFKPSGGLQHVQEPAILQGDQNRPQHLNQQTFSSSQSAQSLLSEHPTNQTNRTNQTNQVEQIEDPTSSRFIMQDASHQTQIQIQKQDSNSGCFNKLQIERPGLPQPPQTTKLTQAQHILLPPQQSQMHQFTDVSSTQQLLLLQQQHQSDLSEQSCINTAISTKQPQPNIPNHHPSSQNENQYHNATESFASPTSVFYMMQTAPQQNQVQNVQQFSNTIQTPNQSNGTSKNNTQGKKNHFQTTNTSNLMIATNSDASSFIKQSARAAVEALERTASQQQIQALKQEQRHNNLTKRFQTPKLGQAEQTSIVNSNPSLVNTNTNPITNMGGYYGNSFDQQLRKKDTSIQYFNDQGINSQTNQTDDSQQNSNRQVFSTPNAVLNETNQYQRNYNNNTNDDDDEVASHLASVMIAARQFGLTPDNLLEGADYHYHGRQEDSDDQDSSVQYLGQEHFQPEHTDKPSTTIMMADNSFLTSNVIGQTDLSLLQQSSTLIISPSTFKKEKVGDYTQAPSPISNKSHNRSHNHSHSRSNTNSANKRSCTSSIFSQALQSKQKQQLTSLMQNLNHINYNPKASLSVTGEKQAINPKLGEEVFSTGNTTSYLNFQNDSSMMISGSQGGGTGLKQHQLSLAAAVQSMQL